MTDQKQSVIVSALDQQDNLLKSITWDREDPILVGRDSKADLSIRDGTVSSTHLRLIPTDDAIIAEDLNSSNGTVFQGGEISQERIEPGDMLQLGSVILEVGDPEKWNKEDEGKETSFEQGFELEEANDPTSPNEVTSSERSRNVFETQRIVRPPEEPVEKSSPSREPISSEPPDQSEEQEAPLENIDWNDLWNQGLKEFSISFAVHILLIIGLMLIYLGGSEPEDVKINVAMEEDPVEDQIDPRKLEPDETEKTEIKKVVKKKKVKPSLKAQVTSEELVVEQKKQEKRLEEMKEEMLPREPVVGTTGSQGAIVNAESDETIYSGSPYSKRQLGGLQGNRMTVEEDKLWEAVKQALLWLARHQNRDGSWHASNFQKHCPVEEKCPGTGAAKNNVGLTSLALLAFLGAGFEPGTSKTISYEKIDEEVKAGRVTQRAVRWLDLQQNQDGSFPGDMYNSSIATLALAEAYGMTSKSILFETLKSGIQYLLKAQTRKKGWRYEYRAQSNDASVTGWCLMALKSAELSGLNVPSQNINWGFSFIKQLTRQKDGRVGYTAVDDQRMNLPALTAVGMMTRMFFEQNREDPMLEKGTKLMEKKLPKWPSQDSQYDFYYWYYGTLALYQFDGPITPNGSGPVWEAWIENLSDTLLPHQNELEDGHLFGSWNPQSLGSKQGGRIYSTALNALTLQFYYRYPNVFTGLNKE